MSRRVRIADIARTFAGGTPDRAVPSYFGGGIPWVKSAEVANSLIETTEETLTEQGLAESSAKWASAGSTLVAMYGANAAQVGRLAIRATTNQAVLCVEAKSPEDSGYLYHAVSAAASLLLRRTQGSGQPNLNAGIVRNLPVPWPAASLRRSVAHAADGLERALALLARLIERKRTFKRALMQDLLTGRRRFGEFVGQPTPRVRAGDICDIRIGGTPRRDTPKYWASSGDGFPWVSIADLKSGLVCDTSERITLAGVQESNVKLITAGTTIMSFKLTIGRTAKAGCDLYTNEAIAGFVPLTETVSNDFLRLILPLAVHSVSPETAVKGATLNKGKLTEIILRLPSLPEQERICAVGEVLDREIACCEQLLNQHELLKRGLMQKLLSGEIAVPDRIGTPD